MSTSSSDFYRKLASLVTAKVREIKEETIARFPSTSNSSKDINIIFKSKVSKLPDDTSYYIIIRDRLIWVNQHESIIRHSTFENVKKEIYVTMTRNLYELLVGLVDAKRDKKLEVGSLPEICAVFYTDYHKICQNFFGDLGKPRDVSTHLLKLKSMEYPPEIESSIEAVLSDSSEDFPYSSKTSFPVRQMSEPHFLIDPNSIWKTRGPSKRSSL